MKSRARSIRETIRSGRRRNCSSEGARREDVVFDEAVKEVVAGRPEVKNDAACAIVVSGFTETMSLSLSQVFRAEAGEDSALRHQVTRAFVATDRSTTDKLMEIGKVDKERHRRKRNQCKYVVNR